MKKRLVVTVALASVLILVLLVAMVANAQEPYSSDESGEIGEFGLADPPPAGMSVVYMFTGVANHSNPVTRTIATSVHCSNFASTDIQVQLQLFGLNGATADTVAFTIPSNRTRTTSTQDTKIFREDFILNNAIIEQGSGRVLADKDQLICTAQLLDPVNNPPKFMNKLPLFDPFGNPISASRRVYLPLILK
ncbi:MAG: hypothetical protein U0401_16685 [Anaerolineae bacterium]